MNQRTTLWPGKVWQLLMAGLAVVGLLSACGDVGLNTADSGGINGSGQIIAGVGTGGTGIIKVAQAARCNTGLVGGLVFLDQNGNRQPDPQEPFAYTDQKGYFSLRTSDAALRESALLIMAIEGTTTDMATGQLAVARSVADVVCK